MLSMIRAMSANPRLASLSQSLKLPSLDQVKCSPLLLSKLLKMKKIFILQNFWVASHILTVISTWSAMVSCTVHKDNLLWVKSYKSAVFGSIITYLIVLYRSYSKFVMYVMASKDDNTTKLLAMEASPKLAITEFIKDENTQLLGFSLLWFFTDDSIIKIFPLYIYSLLNLGIFLTTQVKPDGSFSKAITPFVSYSEVPLLVCANRFDVLSFLVLLKETLKSGNWYAMIIFMFIWRLRYESSEMTRGTVGLIKGFFDTLISDPDELPRGLNEEQEKKKISALDRFFEDGVFFEGTSSEGSMSGTESE